MSGGCSLCIVGLLCDSLLQQQVHVQEAALAFQLESMLGGVEVNNIVAVEENQCPFLGRNWANVRFDYGIVFRHSGIIDLQHKDAGARAAAIIADRIEQADILKVVTFLDFRDGGIGKCEFHDVIPFFLYVNRK